MYYINIYTYLFLIILKNILMKPYTYKYYPYDKPCGDSFSLLSFSSLLPLEKSFDTHLIID